MKFTNFLFFLFSCLFLFSCKEQHEIVSGYEEPSLVLKSCEAISDSSFTVELELTRGKGFKNLQLQLFLYDQDSLSLPPVQIDVDLSKEQYQEIIKEVKFPQFGHDYMVYAQLETQKNVFVSGPLRLTHYDWETGLSKLYGAPTIKVVFDNLIYHKEGVGGCTFAGDEFIVYIGGEAKNQPVEVFVGDFPTEIDWETGFRTDGMATLYVTLPSDIPAGIYDVTLCFEKVTLKSNKKIEVLPWTPGNDEIEGENVIYDDYATFCLDDMVYYLGRDNVCYDIQNDVWKQMPQKIGYLDAATTCNGFGYAMCLGRMYRYDPNSKKWTSVGKEPIEFGDIFKFTIFFSIGDYLYLGGDGYSVQRYFWRYDTMRETWQRMSDLPQEIAFSVACCGCSDCAYVMADKGFLWKYNVVTDSWEKKERLIYDYFEEYTDGAMIFHEGKLIFVSGKSAKTISEYDPETNNWTLKSYYSFGMAERMNFHPAVYVRNQKLFVGPITLYWGANILLNFEMR